MNFDIYGNVRACCMNTLYPLGKYPNQTLKDIWFGKNAQMLREKISVGNFNYGCQGCLKQIKNNNAENALFKNYEMYKEKVNFLPVNLEFEIYNTCNYECIMCGGEWSSSIRKNREKKKQLKFIYDDKFLNEISFFIPYLQSVKFLGGEPFLISFYYKIWELLKIYNKSCKIHITTNGSILNNKIKEIINNFENIKITFSLDSLNSKTYSTIRVNGNFEKVYSNFNYLLNSKKIGGISYCPLIQNIYELPNIIKLCEDNDINLSVNNVYEPLGGEISGIHYRSLLQKIFNKNNLLPKFNLSNLSNNERDKIISYLKNFKFSVFYQKKLDGVINFIKSLNEIN